MKILKTLLAIIGAITVFLIVSLGGFAGVTYLKNKNRVSVPSEGMAPNILRHDQVEIDYEAYKTAEPAPGEVVVYSTGKDKHLGRVVGVAGDVIAFEKKNDRLVVNNKLLSEGDGETLKGGIENPDAYIVLSETLGGHTYNVIYQKEGQLHLFDKNVTIEKGFVFIAGDNRDNSKDSRWNGPIPLENVLGRALEVVKAADISRVGNKL